MSNHSLSRAMKIVALRDAKDVGLLYGLTQLQIAAALDWDPSTLTRVLRQIRQIHATEVEIFARFEAAQQGRGVGNA